MSSPETPRSQVPASPEEAATAPKAVIFGCAGLTLGEAERDFFRTANPLGFILFANNCESPDQIRALTAALRASVGRDDALVLIDQEGGKVARLKPPHWRAAPAAAAFGTLFERDREGALEAARLDLGNPDEAAAAARHLTAAGSKRAAAKMLIEAWRRTPAPVLAAFVTDQHLRASPSC